MVAVSEAAATASQQAGKKAAVIGALLLAPSISNAVDFSGNLDFNWYDRYGRSGNYLDFVGNTTITANQFLDVTADTVFFVRPNVNVEVTASDFQTYCRHGCDYTAQIFGTFTLGQNTTWSLTGGSHNTLWIRGGGTANIYGNWSYDSGTAIYIDGGGTLRTTAQNLFNDVKSSTSYVPIAISVINGANQLSSVSSNSYANGYVSQTVGSKRNRPTTNNGTIVITNIADGTDAANSIRNSLPGNVVFAGGSSSLGANSAFDTRLINTLINEGFRDMVYYANDLLASNDLIIGAGTGDEILINGNTGFRSIANANVVSVMGGRTLTLTGNGDSNYQLIQSGGGITVSSGTLRLGSTAIGTNGGRISGTNLTDSGSLNVVTGNYVIDNIRGGAVIANSGSLRAISLDQVGTLNNSGSLSFDNISYSDKTQINQTTGSLTTKFENLLVAGESVVEPLQTIGLQKDAPISITTVETELFKTLSSGSINADFASHANLTGGKVIATGVNLTQNQADNLLKAFKAKFFLPDAFTSAVSQQC